MGCAAAARPCARRLSAACCTAVTATPTSLFGRRMTRVEDAPLLRGQGRFVDDLDIPGALHVAFLRSPVAHGRLKGIDASAAKGLAGVHAVLTFADLRPLPHLRPHSAGDAVGRDPLPCRSVRAGQGRGRPTSASRSRWWWPRAAASPRTRWRLIAARHRGAAGGDRSGRGSRARRSQGAARLPDNLVARQSIDYGDIDGAFARAAHRIDAALSAAQGRRPFDRDARHRRAARSGRRHADRVRQHPGAASRAANHGRGARPLRAATSAWWRPTPAAASGRRPRSIPRSWRVPAAALLLRRPLKWMEDRRENFVATGGERDQVWDMEIAVDTQGRMLALRGRLCHDHGSPHAVRRRARLQRRHQRDRPLRAAGLSARHQLVPDQLRALRADARRRPPAGHVCDGAAARCRRREARHRARRGAAAQHDPAVADALCDADQAARRLDHGLRQRRLSGVPAPRA